MATRIAWLALAGALGALCRYGVYYLMVVDLKERFPWPTIAVNLLGCFLFSFLAVLADEGRMISAEARTILLAGFLGSFTTFSTFAYETIVLFEHKNYGYAALSLLANNLGGVIAVLLGFVLARALCE